MAYEKDYETVRDIHWRRAIRTWTLHYVPETVEISFFAELLELTCRLIGQTDRRQGITDDAGDMSRAVCPMWSRRTHAVSCSNVAIKAIEIEET